MPLCGRSQERRSDQKPSIVLTWTSQNPSPSSSRAYSPCRAVQFSRKGSARSTRRESWWPCNAGKEFTKARRCVNDTSPLTKSRRPDSLRAGVVAGERGMSMGRLSNRTGPVRSTSRLTVETAPRHLFCDHCNEVLAEAKFDETVEALCQPYYAELRGRPGPTVDPAGAIFPHAFRRPVRGPGFRTRHCLARCGLPVPAPFPAARGG